MYGLIHNEKIQVGPRNWNYAFFKDYLDEHSLDSSSLPANEPIVSINENAWKILRVTEIDVPQIDSLFEMNVGPFWTIHEDKITGSYTKKDRSIELVKGDMKSIVAKNRYDLEVSDIYHTFEDGEEVILYTSREERNVYLNTHLAMQDDETVPFKFKNGSFRSSVTKSELSTIVGLIKNHVKAAFGWEDSKVSEINTCVTLDDLRLVELKHQSQIEDTDG